MWGLLPPLLAVILRIAVGPLTVDDAFITFRYARNISENLGFVYNAGERVLGTTTPLWAALLAAVHRLGMTDLPRFAWLLNAALDGATAWMLFKLGAELAGWRSGVIAGLLFALSSMSIAYAAGGMESSLFVFVLTAGMLSTLYRRTRRAALLAGTATLIRPEGLLVAALLLGGLAKHRRQLPVTEALIYLVTILPWMAFATLYFGSPLPQTVSAKSVVYQIEPLINALALTTHAVLPSQSLFLLASGPSWFGWVVAALVASPLLVALALHGSQAWLRAGPPFSVWLLFPLAYAAAYVIAGLRGVRMFHWYVIPLAPFYVLVLAMGSQALAQRIATRQRAAGMLLGAFLVTWWLPGILASGQPGYPAGFSLARERVYREVALDYADRWGPGTIVAAPEIGTIGYHIRGSILDTVGLVSPVAARYYPLPSELLASDNAVAPHLIRDLQPDYVVSLDQFIRSSLLPDPEFQRSYRLVEARSAPIWESTQLFIFERVANESVRP